MILGTHSIRRSNPRTGPTRVGVLRRSHRCSRSLSCMHGSRTKRNVSRSRNIRKGERPSNTSQTERKSTCDGVRSAVALGYATGSREGGECGSENANDRGVSWDLCGGLGGFLVAEKHDPTSRWENRGSQASSVA